MRNAKQRSRDKKYFFASLRFVTEQIQAKKVTSSNSPLAHTSKIFHIIFRMAPPRIGDQETIDELQSSGSESGTISSLGTDGTKKESIVFLVDDELVAGPSNFISNDLLADEHEDLTNITVNLYYKPVNRKMAVRSSVFLSFAQLSFLIVALSTYWVSLDLFSPEGSILELQDIDIWANVDLYRDANCYELVVLMLIFDVSIPLFVACIYAMTIYAQYRGLDHTLWLPPRDDINYLTETNEKTLLPWWKGVSYFEGSLASLMKISTIAMDFLMTCTRMFFSQICLTTLLILSINFQIEDGYEVATKCHVGGFSYNLSILAAFSVLTLLNYSLLSWTRSYKERVIKVEYGGMHVRPVADEQLGARQPLLYSDNVSQGNRTSRTEMSMMKKGDLPVYILLFLCLSSWITIASGIDFVKYKSVGTSTYHLTMTSNGISIYSYYSDGWHSSDHCGPGYRAASVLYTFAYVVLIPTICMVLSFTIFIGSKYVRFYESPLYRYNILAMRLLSPWTCQTVFSLILFVFALEIERITKPMFNITDECKAETCLAVEGEITVGTFVFFVWAISLHLLMLLASKRFGHLLYRIHDHFPVQTR